MEIGKFTYERHKYRENKLETPPDMEKKRDCVFFKHLNDMKGRINDRM